jgi:hypothetical protein
MWHVTSGLPWAWRRGESGSSERQHFQEMIPELPKKSLVVADAGFAGYSYWKSLMDAGHDFIIRVGANVTLLTQLGYVRETRDCVYLWPDKAAADSQPPLILRLVVLTKRGKKVVFVTSVLSSAALSKKEVISIAKSRWGVEVFFRSWKQTFDKRKLRSHKSEHALIELDWSLVGLWSVCLVAQLENRRLKPKKLSVAKVLRAFRRPMREYATRPRIGQELFERLSNAQIDSYVRTNKNSRNYPRKKKSKPKLGVPIIQKATSKQRKRAAMLKGKPKNAA